MVNLFKRIFGEDLPAFGGGGIVGGIASLPVLANTPLLQIGFLDLLLKLFGLIISVAVSGFITVLIKDFYEHKIKNKLFKSKNKDHGKKDEDSEAA